MKIKTLGAFKKHIWDATSNLREKFIVVHAYPKKQEKVHINNLTIPNVARKRTNKAENWQKKVNNKDQHRNK